MEFSRPITQNLPDKERFMLYFESLSKTMDGRHDWTSANDGPPAGRSYRFKSRANTESFWNLLRGECCYRAWFPEGDTEIVAGFHIRESQVLLDTLHKLKTEIESDFGGTLDWTQRLCRNPKTQKRKLIFVSRNGSIQSPERELQEIGEWHIETLLKLNQVFTPRIVQISSQIER